MDKHKNKKLLLDFHLEVYKIWESWHVMDQRNVHDLFTINVWPNLKSHPDIQLDSKIAALLKPFEDYNATMKDFKDYQEFYNSDVRNKTIENGRILHEKREVVREKFRSLKPHIDPLRKVVEEQLIQLKVLI